MGKRSQNRAERWRKRRKISVKLAPERLSSPVGKDIDDKGRNLTGRRIPEE
jgi:hypothetical protein